MAFTGNSVGDTVTYTCNLGFELIGNVTTTCTQVDANSAVFQPAPPFCRREYSNRRLSVVVTFHLQLHVSIALALCYALILFYTALCSDPVDIDFGTVMVTGNSIGDTATYSCNLGFELTERAIITCTEMEPSLAAFSPSPPSCRRECAKYILYHT